MIKEGRKNRWPFSAIASLHSTESLKGIRKVESKRGILVERDKHTQKPFYIEHRRNISSHVEHIHNSRCLGL